MWAWGEKKAMKDIDSARWIYTRMSRKTQVQPNQLIQLCTRTRRAQPINILWVWVTDGDPCSRKRVQSNQDKSEKAQETNANSSLGLHSKIKSVDILIKVS